MKWITRLFPQVLRSLRFLRRSSRNYHYIEEKREQAVHREIVRLRSRFPVMGG